MFVLTSISRREGDTKLYEIFVLMSISRREGVACGQYFITIVLYEVFVLMSISNREGVTCSCARYKAL